MNEWIKKFRKYIFNRILQPYIKQNALDYFCVNQYNYQDFGKIKQLDAVHTFTSSKFLKFHSGIYVQYA